MIMTVWKSTKVTSGKKKRGDTMDLRQSWRTDEIKTLILVSALILEEKIKVERPKGFIKIQDAHSCYGRNIKSRNHIYFGIFFYKLAFACCFLDGFYIRLH